MSADLAGLLRDAYGTPDLPSLWWMSQGRCGETDPEIFFLDKGGSPRPAKRICAGCEVRARCLEYALATGQGFGIWGGLSERDRRRAAPLYAAGASTADILAAADETDRRRAERAAARNLALSRQNAAAWRAAKAAAEGTTADLGSAA